MILDEITLYNFGLYSDRQTISLTPASSCKPVVLLGGLNGGGKTTFLDALQLCLFGPHAKISNRGSLAYNEYLSRSIHRGADSPKAAIEISFRHTNEGREDSYNLRRSWHQSNGGCKEAFKVWKNGTPDAALAENWVTQVEDFIPPNIAHLFLFDGEKIEGYASYNHSTELIGTAIQNLLGLDIVDQLKKDLVVYERRKRSETKDDETLARTKAAESQLKDLRQRADELNQERASVQSHGIDRTQRSLSKIEEEYRKLGGDLFDRRIELEQRLTDANRAVQENAEVQRETAADLLPLLMVKPLLESAESRDHHEVECRRARDVSNVLQTRDRATLRELRSQSVDKDTLEVLKKFFRDDQAKRQALGKNEALLDLSPDVRSDLHSLLRDDLEDSADSACKQQKQQKQLEKIAAHAYAEFESIPSTDMIQDVAERRDEIKEELARHKRQYAVLSDEIKRLYHNIERKEQTLMRMHETDAKAMSDSDDRARILRHAARVRRTLSTFRNAVVRRHVRRIEQLILGSYQQLLRKDSLVTRLAIDPEKFSITLYGRDGQMFTAERLSAGERQLLGIALLWGLAKASGRPLPTAIDTPLGRLDAGHRMHLVERYLPFASHQVLLLSTDEEIAGDYLDRLKPWIGKSYYLNYDDNAGKTQIVPGYFGEVSAA